MTEIIAHRGDSAHAPENTLAAFELAIAKGASRIELDLRLTADGEVCVFHDQDLNRLTHESGPVAARTLSELQRITVLGSRFSPTADTKICSLAEVLERIGSRVPLYLEIKTDGCDSESMVQLTHKCIDMIPPTSPHVLGSFDLRVVSRCLLAGRPVALIATQQETLFELDDDEVRALRALSLWHENVDASVIERCRRFGIRLWTWTSDTAEDWSRLRSLGASTAWCTNDVAALAAWLDKEGEAR